MTPDAFHLLRKGETTWWYAARRSLVRTLIQRLPPSVTSALDFGAGHGGMREAFPSAIQVDALEPELLPAESCRTRGYIHVLATLPEPGRYQLIGAFDVIEHIEDEHAALKALHDQLQPGGHLVVTVPAFPSLWSIHDTDHHHFRRYTRKTLRAALEAAGFHVRWINYWNITLFPIAYLLRKSGRSGQSAFALPVFADRLIRWWLWLEERILLHITVPWGTSVAAVAQRSDTPTLPTPGSPD